MSDLSEHTTLVVGAGRGLGRGIALALDEAGAPVIAVARSESDLSDLAAEGRAINIEAADATDPAVAWSLLDEYRPRILVLVAGARPVMCPLHHQTWETFSAYWETDVKIAFTWLREALLQPLPHGSRVVVVSSGAAINGSPASGGYAGAKATQRFIAEYVQEESRRSGSGITVTTVLPRMTPFGEVGRRAIRAYAARSGQTEEAYVEQFGQVLTPGGAGSAIVDLVIGDPSTTAAGYLLTGAGVAAVALTLSGPLRTGSRPTIARRRRSATARPGRTSPRRIGRAARRRPATATRQPAATTAWAAGSPGSTCPDS